MEPGLQFSPRYWVKIARGSPRGEAYSAWRAEPEARRYPLSSWLDENDAIFVMDNVFVPWEDVFVYADVEKANDFFPRTGTAKDLVNTDDVSAFH